MAGDDIRSMLSPELAANLDPVMQKWMRDRLSQQWPGGTLNLVSRKSLPNGQNQITSTFRVVKGADAMLVVYTLNPDGKISDFYPMSDRPYE
jgi:hypothetical protein